MNTVRQDSKSLVSRNRQYRAFTCRIASSSSATVVSVAIVHASSAEIYTVTYSVSTAGRLAREGPVHLEGDRLVHDRLVARVPVGEVRPLVPA